MPWWPSTLTLWWPCRPAAPVERAPRGRVGIHHKFVCRSRRTFENNPGRRFAHAWPDTACRDGNRLRRFGLGPSRSRPFPPLAGAWRRQSRPPNTGPGSCSSHPSTSRPARQSRATPAPSKSLAWSLRPPLATSWSAVEAAAACRMSSVVWAAQISGCETANAIRKRPRSQGDLPTQGRSFLSMSIKTNSRNQQNLTKKVSFSIPTPSFPGQASTRTGRESN